MELVLPPPLCGFRGSSTCCQAFESSALPTESSFWPPITFHNYNFSSTSLGTALENKPNTSTFCRETPNSDAYFVLLSGQAYFQIFRWVTFLLWNLQSDRASLSLPPGTSKPAALFLWVAAGSSPQNAQVKTGPLGSEADANFLPSKNIKNPDPG